MAPTKAMALVGATDHGAVYELKPNSKVKDVLALGGGLSALVSQQKALLERIGGQTAQSTQPNNSANRQVQNLTLNTQGLDIDLKDGDVLVLLPISPAFANAITLQGTVAQPLRHPWVAQGLGHGALQGNGVGKGWANGKQHQYVAIFQVYV